tara:strand:- start:376 stop:543 length:168 start_codon:yes stop_codon:yes gene_type:complete
MEWLTNQKQKCWDKAYQEYILESGLSSKQVSDFIKVNPYVALSIENKAIEFLKQT